jgi:NADH:ubiquinone oxidoreductase subunit
MSYSFPIRLYKYFNYYITASSGKGHGVHSPFVFNFISSILNNKELKQEANYSNKYRALLIRMVAYYMPVVVMELEATPSNKANVLEGIENADSMGLLYIKQIKNAEVLMSYFNAAIKKVNTQSILIFEGIHESKEMEANWEKIKMHYKVKLTIDLYKLGIVFFRQEQLEKENFTIRF